MRPERHVLIAGGGIAGLTTALSLHAIGVPVEVFESTEQIRSLGVGINLLPHAVRELDALGLLAALEAASVAPTTLAYFSKHGHLIWSERRGRPAGYAWPQLSIHRGTLQRILLDAVVDRIGADHVHTGHHLVGFEAHDDRAVARFSVRTGGEPDYVERVGAALIAADGIHSVGRGQIYPGEGMPKWNGALLWRGLVEREPVIDGRTMIWAGHPRQKFVGYPILDIAGDDGRRADDADRQLFNFIAELRTGDTQLAEREDWNRAGDLADFLPRFESWRFDWLDVPALIRAAPGTFVFPMVDRDPVERWTVSTVTLLGDAAHPMYPIGSNDASQAILDARVLAGCLRAHSEIAAALAAYESVRRPATSAIVLANRGLGPELPMQLVEERAPDGFDRIEDVITPDEISAVTEGYRATAGFALAALSDPRSLADRDY